MKIRDRIRRRKERKIEAKQAKCKHDAFTYDSDTDVTYCDLCDASIYCGDLFAELYLEATGEFDEDGSFSYEGDFE